MSNCEYQNYIYMPYISQHVKSLWFACQSIKNKFCIYLFISMHDIQDNNISNLNYLKRKPCLREQKEGKKKKIYLNSFLFIPIWSLPFPTRSNTSMKTLNHNKNQKIILIFYINSWYSTFNKKKKDWIK